eukprot:GGOE01041075.1.p1 GENE.GGOE01041075.1~~GGOE01041075.1.p1  ORF type:complete len:464 (+),score=150.08 GGOE01041075.1:72-1394(+)
MSRGPSWWSIVLTALGLVLLIQTLFSTHTMQASLDDLHAELREVREGKATNPSSRLEARLSDFLQMSKELQSYILDLKKEQEALHSTVKFHTKKIKEKLDEQVDANARIQAKLDDHASAHEDINAKLEAHAAQHVDMATKNAQAHAELAKQVEDQTKGIHEKLDAQKDVAEYELPGGGHLTTPWRVNGSTVFLEDKYLFRIDGEGHVKFRDSSITHVQLHVGSGNASLIEPLLVANKSLFVFAISPFTAKENLAKSGRFVWIPAGVLHTPGFQKFQRRNYAVIRLEQLLQMVNPALPIEAIKVYEGHDHFDLLTTGHFITQLPRVIIQLQDLPPNHSTKRLHVSNTTTAIRKLKQKGLHALCCKCLKASTWDVECYFARRGFMNLTSDWPRGLTGPEFPADEECSNPYDKATGQALPLAAWRKVWSVPMCRQQVAKGVFV